MRRRRVSRGRLGLTLALTGLTVAGVLLPAPSEARPIPPNLVLGRPRFGEFQPVRGGGFLAWQQNSKSHPNHYDVFARPDGGGARFRVNVKGTNAANGAIDGQRLVYQQYGHHASALEFFSLTKRKRWPLPGKVNTPQWEYWPRISGHRLLFGRLEKNGSRRIVLFNLEARSSRTLDRTKNPKSFLAPGQINGEYAVWEKCGPTGKCSVIRHHIGNGARIVLSSGRYSQRAPSVSPEGVVYFVRSGLACGHGVTLVRRPLNGPTAVLWRLNTGNDVSSTSLYVGPDGKRTLYYDDHSCGRFVGSDVWRIHNPDGIVLSVVLNGDGHGTVTSEPAGIGCGTDCSEAYGPGTQVTLTATPDENSVFTGWTGVCTGTQQFCVVTMSASKSVTATFDATQGLTVIPQGNGHGAVSSDPPGIDCGTDCSENYAPDTEVTLTEHPGAGSVFVGWGGACSGKQGTCALTMDTPKSVTASFTLKRFTLTVTRTGEGSVTSKPAGVACPSDCTERYDYGTRVTLTPHPGEGWHFVRWSGACQGQTCVIKITQDATARAVFAQDAT